MSDLPVVTEWHDIPCIFCGTPVTHLIDFRVAVPCMCGAKDRTDRRRALRLTGGSE